MSEKNGTLTKSVSQLLLKFELYPFDIFSIQLVVARWSYLYPDGP